ncbi:MAG: riboflavin synthase subunit alpha [Chloroflexi bacterium RBG_13_46_14]|nr:MAG: riboflavin synthase subunit alpha [Chloroflexi bacterium RBG_13_46_14]
MFTGIVEEVGKVVSTGNAKLIISAGKVVPGLKPGDSVAVNGVCLTVTALTAESFSVDVMPETSERSNIELLRVGDRVNVEPALALGGPMGGHLVQGHIDTTGKIASMKWQGKAMIVGIEAPPSVMRYIVEKGFISVDGISLTVVERDNTSFRVSVVDFTRQNTTLGDRKVGDIVNLEADIIAKYVEQFTKPQDRGITPDFLAEHGFLVG